jgi:hypothetical protein
LNSENVADGALLEIKFDEVTVDEWVEVEYDAGVIATL